MRALKRCLKNQFSTDGVNFESSVQYHRYIFELLLFLIAVLYKNNYKVEHILENTVIKIGESLKLLTHKNGYISRFGDNDGGKFLYDLGTIEEFNSLNYLNWFNKDNRSSYFETLIF